MNANTHDKTVAPTGLATAIAATLETPVPPPAVVKTVGGHAKLAVTFLSRKSDKEKVTTVARIIDGLTDNPAFVETSPRLAVVTAAYDAYVKAVNGLNRSPASIAVRDNTRSSLVLLLRDLALYLQHASEGDRVKLISTGFPLQKQRGVRLGLPAVPGNARLRRTRLTTQLQALCDPVPSASYYQWRYAPAATPEAWIEVNVSTSTRCLLPNLVPGTAYVAQVRAYTTRGPGEWSNVASMIAS